jgi:hypothetical protein
LIGVAVALGSLASFVGYVWLSRELAHRDARSTLHEAIPADSRVLDESIFYCARDDDAGPPYCGTADVRLPGSSSSTCKTILLRNLNARGYRFLMESPDVDAIRGHDEIYVGMAVDTSWCRVSVRYTWHSTPKTHF